MNGWLEQTRQEAVDLAGSAIGTDVLIALAVLVCFLLALSVRRRSVPDSPAPPLVPQPPVPEVSLPGVRALETVRDDDAGRAHQVVAELMTALGAPARAGSGAAGRAARLEEQGGHLTQAVVGLVGLGRGWFGVGRQVRPTLTALATGDTGPARALLASLTQPKGGADPADPEGGVLFRHLATLSFLEDPAAALAPVRRAASLLSDHPEVWSLYGLIALQAGALDEARGACEKVLQVGSGFGNQVLLAGALGTLGEIHQTQGAFDRAEEYFRIALTYQAGLARPGGMIRHYRQLCQLSEARGDLGGAADILSRAMALEAQLGRSENLADLETHAADLARRRDRLADACGHWAQARQLFQELGNERRAKEIDAAMATALQGAPPPRPGAGGRRKK